MLERSGLNFYPDSGEKFTVEAPMIFDVNNYPEFPDSNLDSDNSLKQIFTIAEGVQMEVAPGDWLDIDPGSITPDPDWGFSFQCCQVYPEFGVVGILVCLNPTEEPMNRIYAETCVSPSLITNIFVRKAPLAGA